MDRALLYIMYIFQPKKKKEKKEIEKKNYDLVQIYYLTRNND